MNTTRTNPLTSKTKLNDQVSVIDFGKLSDLSWPGKVSADKLMKKKVINSELIDNIVDQVDTFYVNVKPKAKTRCIDGRLDPEFDENNLGPQVPGGAPGAALAFRLGVDKDDLTRGTFFADAEAMIRNFIRLGFSPGGHRDEDSHGKKNVGCGAIDSMDQILKVMVDPAYVDDHKRVVKLLLGSEFDKDTYLRVLGAAVVVNGRSQEYFDNREAIINELEKRSHKSVSVLRGNHQESIVIVNLIPGTTLASNRLSKEFKGMQAFGYDLWRSKQMANKILPRADQSIDRQRFVMARVMCTVATLMALTDGTQRFIVRAN